jgi:hypothetical protein
MGDAETDTETGERGRESVTHMGGGTLAEPLTIGCKESDEDCCPHIEIDVEWGEDRIYKVVLKFEMSECDACHFISQARRK